MIARMIRGLAAATALVAASSSASQAQFAVSGGLAMPMGDFGDAAEMGFQVGGSYTKGLGEMLQLRISADYSRMAVKSNPLFDGNWGLLGASANVVYPVGGEMGFYALGGLGFYQYSLSIDGAGSDSETDLAWNVGAGVGKGKWFVEARYLSIMADPALNAIPIVFGWRF